MVFGMRGSVLRKWLFSYLLILIIPITGAFVNYAYTRGVITQEIAASNELALRGAMAGIDGDLKAMRSTAEALCRSETLRSALNPVGSASATTRLMPELVRTIYSLSDSQPAMETFAYLSSSDYFVGRNTANPLPMIASTVRFIRRSTLSEEEYMALIRETHYAGEFIVSGDYSYSNHQEPAVVYARSYKPLSQKSGPHVNVFSIVPVGRFVEYLTKTGPNVALAFDEEGRLLFQSGLAAGLLDGLTLREPNRTGTLEYMIDGARYLGCAMRSEVCGWTFALLRPEAQFWTRAGYISRITITTLVLAVLIGLACAVLLVRKNYRPVRQTLRSIAPDIDADAGDEFAFIRDSYQSLAHAHRDAQQALATQREALRSNYLYSHLRGSSGMLPDAEIQAALDLDFTGQRFAIVSFLLDEEAVQNPQDGRDPVASAVDSLFARAFIGMCTACALPKDHLHTWLLTFPAARQDELIGALPQKLETVVRYLRDSLGTTTSALVCAPIMDFAALPGAYQAILDYSDYQYVAGGGGVVAVPPQPCAANGQREAENIDLLCEAVVKQRTGDACAVLGRLFDGVNADSAGTILRLRACGWIAALLEYDSIASRIDERALRKHIAALEAAESGDDIREQAMLLTRQLCGCAPDDRAEGRLSQRVQAYVDEHYADCNLSLSAIADAFGLNPKYLSRLYRTETNQSLIDYIHRTRISRAVALLREGGMTIGAISEKVGYASVKTFRRYFIRFEGFNPSEFDE